MAIKLKAESWHYKFFKKQLPYSSAPQTLCPYFWIMVGLLVSYPSILIGKGLDKFLTYLFGLLPKKKRVEKSLEQWEREYRERRKKERIKEERMHKIGKFFGNILLYGVLPIFGATILFFMILELIRIPLIHTLAGLGIAIVISLIIVGIISFFDKFGDKVFDFLSKIIGTPIKLCWSMIKAGYEKACPLVEWEGDVYKETKKNYHNFN